MGGEVLIPYISTVHVPNPLSQCTSAHASILYNSSCTAAVSFTSSNFYPFLMLCIAILYRGPLQLGVHEAVETTNAAVAEDVAMDQNPAYGTLTCDYQKYDPDYI